VHSNGQNLVLNPSFETYTNCPTAGGQINYSTNWYNPCSNGSPDYYNSCAFGPSVPYCGGPCFQYAKHGNAYAGLYTYDGITSNLREYLQAQLSTPLISGKCYFAGFYVNEVNWCGLAANNIGMYYSSMPVSCFGPTYFINQNSQIKSYKNKIIKDTLNWILISGIFQSTNNEKYITIGNFNLDNTTDTLSFNPNASAPKYAYYLIDSVFCIPVDSIFTTLNAAAGNDVTINLGDSTFIGREISNLNCDWFIGTNLISSNQSGIYVKPNTTTTYIVKQNLCGNITTDTVVVTVNTGTYIYNYINKSEFVLTPNPVDDILNINAREFVNKENLSIKIIDMLGRDVMIKDYTQQLNVSSFEKGIYFISIQEGGKTLVTKKIIINH
jgi:hypothetical protein